MANAFHQKVTKGERFQFGENWNRFLAVLNDERIAEAKHSLQEMLELETLQGKRFLDIGSGSGLFSLAARQLGAAVFSFDCDPNSVACTKELQQRYFPDDSNWVIQQGSVLDEQYLSSLGTFDIVYSWGVLHHTGAMWKAIDNVSALVAKNGKLFIAIYNDLGGISKRWKIIKRTYNQMPAGLRFIILWPAFVGAWWKDILRDLLRGKPFHTWETYASSRGMSPWIDCVDWVGGYPFEVAKPEEIFHFYRERGYCLEQLKTRFGNACNEFVFTKK